MSSSLAQWRHKAFLSIGVSLRGLPHWSHHVPSLNGWGQCGVRETEVNYTVRLEQQFFLLVLRHCHMLVHFNIDVLYHYDNNQESKLDGAVYLAWKLIRWVHPWLASLRELTFWYDTMVWQMRCQGTAYAWPLHPGVVYQIWEKFGRAQVDLFANGKSSHRWLDLTVTAHVAQNSAIGPKSPTHWLKMVIEALLSIGQNTLAASSLCQWVCPLRLMCRLRTMTYQYKWCLAGGS